MPRNKTIPGKLCFNSANYQRDDENRLQRLKHFDRKHFSEHPGREWDSLLG
jgi:hypothetical protein